ncbi:MAG: VCBS repeat-containing protein [Pyrinomonadaceae bacterium]|nr:VCBS repeat-containing protein [Pyrinomonadaceae bacterium]
MTHTLKPKTLSYILTGILPVILLLTGNWVLAQKLRMQDTETRPVLSQQDALFDFDGDGKTDISIYRYSEGEWWSLNSNGGNSATKFGTQNDYPLADDFTGDGVTDRAFFRFSTGEWFVLRSEDHSYYSFPFGTNNDFPFTGDFDGDGKADPGLFRSLNGPGPSTYYIKLSSGGVRIEQFGSAGDQTYTSDYDGDGKDDLAIYRSQDAEWWIKESSTGIVRVYKFGIEEGSVLAQSDHNLGGGSFSYPIPADYTGDGKTDVAYFTNQGEWYVLRSEDESYYSFPFGTDQDFPLLGDYDGDGRADPGVLRPTNNTWYLLQSTEGFKAVTFGDIDGSTDIPLSAYRTGIL